MKGERMALLTVCDVSLGYEGKTVAQNLNFTVERGDYLCVVGENGTGKSTLMRALIGLKQPQSGAIEIGDGLCANEIGYLPQQTPAQKDFPASVREVVLSGCLNRCGLRPFYNGTEHRLAAETMERLGIARLAQSCYRELSGGQQQRVLLARALCAARALLLLDEPAAGLDPMGTADLHAIIEKLNHDGGLTVVMVSHDIPAAVKYASHILHVGKEAQFFGKTASYVQSRVGSVFLSGTQGELL